jgi:hypothetical protein
VPIVLAYAKKISDAASHAAEHAVDVARPVVEQAKDRIAA